jgi:DNA invertase Pin-like site-specific DNA recombinase
VLGLEVSRLARNNADWHRLLEICAVAGTLICDEDGLYDPGEFNDRLLLGLKGTMSEAELHFIRARLRGGQLSKARRGELVMALPVGLMTDPAGKVVLDPDAGVQHAISHLFATFARTGSARAVVQAFTAEGLLFPSGSGPAPTRANWHGRRCATGGCCAPSTTPDTPARSSTAAAASARPPRAAEPSRPCPKTSG